MDIEIYCNECGGYLEIEHQFEYYGNWRFDVKPCEQCIEELTKEFEKKIAELENAN